MLSVCVDFLFPKEVRDGIPTNDPQDKEVCAQDESPGPDVNGVSMDCQDYRQDINQER